MIEKLNEKVHSIYGEGSHGFCHVQRVMNFADKIAESEDIDNDVLRAAVLLHDIARKEESEGKVECHADEGAKKAESILKEVGFPADKIPAVQYCIRVHRYSKGIKPETTEAKILQDADRLDAIGAIAVGRAFAKGEAAGRPMHDPNIPPSEDYRQNPHSKTTLNHFHEKLLNIKPEVFHTHTAQMLAKERYEFTELFVNRFLDEWGGKR